MRNSKQQDFTIDTLLATHRELRCVDLVDYEIAYMCAGGLKLKIKSGEYWYMYKILKSGAIVETRMSNNDISYQTLKYFQDEEQN